MATSNHSQLTIVEPLCFHKVHGDQITLSEHGTRAKRDRLNNTLLFTNRPILSHEIVQFYIEELSSDYYGLIRIGLTTIDPGSFTRETLPRSMPTNDTREWFVPAPRGSPNIKKNKCIRLKYTAEGDVRVFAFSFRRDLRKTDLDLHRFRRDRLRQVPDRLADHQRCLVRTGPQRRRLSDSSRANASARARQCRRPRTSTQRSLHQRSSVREQLDLLQRTVIVRPGEHEKLRRALRTRR